MGKMAKLLYIFVATLHSLCHGSPLGIGTGLDLKLRTPEGRNFNPVQFANEWVDSVSIAVVPVSPVVKNVEIVPVIKAVPVPHRSTPVFVERESIPQPVVTQIIQPAVITPDISLKTVPVEIGETSPTVIQPVLKPVPVNVEVTQIQAQTQSVPSVVQTKRLFPVEVVSKVYEPIEATPVVVHQESVSGVPVEKSTPLVKNVDVRVDIDQIDQTGPSVVVPAVAPVVKSTPEIVELSPVSVEAVPSVEPSVNVISEAAPIVKSPVSKGDITVLRPIPVLSGDDVQEVDTEDELIIVEEPSLVVPAAVPIVEVTLKDVAEIPVAIVETVVPAVKSSPEIIVAVAPEPLDAPNPPLPTPDVPFRGGQFHAQDEQGQYAFGHYGGSSTRVEAKDTLGRVSGSFAYADPDGDIQVRKYSAAPGVGFKVAASDIPQDTPEVAQVKEELAQLIADTRASNA